MKKLILLLLFPLLGYSQHNFSIVKNNLVWEKVFYSDASPLDIMKQVKLTGKCQYIDYNYDVLDFCITYTREDMKHYGYRLIPDPAFLSGGGLCTGMIEVKDGRYKVTIFKLECYDPEEGLIIEPISDYALKDGELRDRESFERALSYYDQFFTFIFEGITPGNSW